jgi:NAD(P)-dependent dehydrogenase (short-subunit alcohol dehydrogenase family)
MTAPSATGRLSGKGVVVTGATGIAAAASLLIAAEGARVFVISLDEEDCRALAGRITAEGGVCGWAVADLRDGEATAAAVTAAGVELGRIDGLLGVAGGSGRRLGDGPLHELTTPGWRATFEMNALPAMHASQAVVQAMREGGHGGAVVLVSSVLATAPSPELFATHAYASAKGAIDSLVRTAAAYYAREGIRFNAIAPGLVDTPMAARAASEQRTVEYARRKQPLAGGLLTAEDVAGAAAFLLSDAARMITGQVIAVDGGWSVTEAAR